MHKFSCVRVLCSCTVDRVKTTTKSIADPFCENAVSLVYVESVFLTTVLRRL